MLRCPEPHGEAFLVMSTGEMLGRMVRSGILGCPICRREFPILKGIVYFSKSKERAAAPAGAPSGRAPRSPLPVDAESLQALLDLSGPGKIEQRLERLGIDGERGAGSATGRCTRGCRCPLLAL